ncbi:hypothetical protein QMZ92_16570 [Streptomyces sp. HNM0645]|uniref:hypothetical protein n=1 Tax=Streptomyces sp. HNM0645 TaxID=2782343 RepID=UPI0024B76CDC|nr:hypothetical protein [Streptomyces sp. HNM0645]MDI9885949.1 hypothetical protein [Streptomyces sp. HNM0645]
MSDMDRVVCVVAQSMYDEGRTGLDVAEMWISSIVGALIEVQNARVLHPGACPQFGPEATPHVAARRIVARLLDAGWRPPDADCLDLPEIPEAPGA